MYSVERSDIHVMSWFMTLLTGQDIQIFLLIRHLPFSVMLVWEFHQHSALEFIIQIIIITSDNKIRTLIFQQDGKSNIARVSLLNLCFSCYSHLFTPWDHLSSCIKEWQLMKSSTLQSSFVLISWSTNSGEEELLPMSWLLEPFQLALIQQLFMLLRNTMNSHREFKPMTILVFGTFST